jgi:hypothetical protein
MVFDGFWEFGINSSWILMHFDGFLEFGMDLRWILGWISDGLLRILDGSM